MCVCVSLWFTLRGNPNKSWTGEVVDVMDFGECQGICSQPRYSKPPRTHSFQSCEVFSAWTKKKKKKSPPCMIKKKRRHYGHLELLIMQMTCPVFPEVPVQREVAFVKLTVSPSSVNLCTAQYESLVRIVLFSLFLSLKNDSTHKPEMHQRDPSLMLPCSQMTDSILYSTFNTLQVFSRFFFKILNTVVQLLLQQEAFNLIYVLFRQT